MGFSVNPEIGRAHGNSEVVKMLERQLEYVRRGQVNYCALVTCEQPETMKFDFAGSIELEAEVPRVLDALKREVVQSTSSRYPPDLDEDLGANYLCYNIAFFSVGFDFLIDLLSAEMRRVRERAPAPLRVGFWRGFSGRLGLENPTRVKMFEGVHRPLLGMIGAIEDDEAMNGMRYSRPQYPEIIAAVKRGEPVPVLISSQAKWSNPEVVTITLREAEHWPHRNSNLEAWTRFARDLERQGRKIIFVRDTAKANEPLDGFFTSPQASLDLNCRLALYQGAAMNLFTSNGPSTLAMFGCAPVIALNPIREGSEYPPETPQWWADIGLGPGEPYPWLRSNQHMVWDEDTYKNISAAWEAHQ